MRKIYTTKRKARKTQLLYTGGLFLHNFHPEQFDVEESFFMFQKFLSSGWYKDVCEMDCYDWSELTCENVINVNFL